MKNIVFGFALLSVAIFSSCKSDDEKIDPVVVIEAPATYSFERNGNSNVSFGGQTTRIKMAGEIASALKDPTNTETTLAELFADGTGFGEAGLNTSGKNLRSKVAASNDFFSANTTGAANTKKAFDGYLRAQALETFASWDNDASAGVPGKLDELGGKTRYLGNKGLEYDQIFTKGLIGALMMDQILNNYLSADVLDAGENKENNDNGVLEDGKDYTLMEHKWDEGYGYLYGMEANPAVPSANDDAADNFLNKYVKRAAKNDLPNLPSEVYDAFKLGRAAIVGKDYALRDEQAEIIREKISMAIALRAVHYLQAGKSNLDTDKAKAFHGLSEAAGFIYSLQFTREPGKTTPYYSLEEVGGFIQKLIPPKQEGVINNGFWDVTPEILDEVSEAIAAKFDFTVAQAAK